MIYREAGQFKASYASDQAIFPIRQVRWGVALLLAAAYVLIPLVTNDYWLGSILIPFLVLALAALGLNILTGYAGQLSLGSAGFMAVGAFAAYNFMLRVPGMPLLVAFALSGLCAAGVGIVFGIPSLRIKGFYLAVATLAAQFFIEWLFTHFGWFTNYSASGVIRAPPMVILGYEFESTTSRYLLTLTIVAAMALAAKNMARAGVGRAWMAVRHMDVAAELIGIKMLQTKLLAFAISSFCCGIVGPFGLSRIWAQSSPRPSTSPVPSRSSS
jgi:branched-chain amino acid transport system permease protein